MVSETEKWYRERGEERENKKSTAQRCQEQHNQTLMMLSKICEVNNYMRKSYPDIMCFVEPKHSEDLAIVLLDNNYKL